MQRTRSTTHTRTTDKTLTTLSTTTVPYASLVDVEPEQEVGAGRHHQVQLEQARVVPVLHQGDRRAPVGEVADHVDASRAGCDSGGAGVVRVGQLVLVADRVVEPAQVDDERHLDVPGRFVPGEPLPETRRTIRCDGGVHQGQLDLAGSSQSRQDRVVRPQRVAGAVDEVGRRQRRRQQPDMTGVPWARRGQTPAGTGCVCVVLVCAWFASQRNVCRPWPTSIDSVTLRTLTTTRMATTGTRPRTGNRQGALASANIFLIDQLTSHRLKPGYWGIKAKQPMRPIDARDRFYTKPGLAVSMELWHERFGHASYKQIQALHDSKGGRGSERHRPSSRTNDKEL